MEVEWNRCARNRWCELNTVDLSHELFAEGGVYLVWNRGDHPAVLQAGCGNIRDKLTALKNSPEYQPYKEGDVRFAWAIVREEDKRAGAAAYLAEKLKPLLGGSFPGVVTIPVNLPS